MKFYIVASILSFIGSCATLSHKEKIENIKNSIIINQPSQIVSYANTITARELNNHLYQFASTDFEGRNVGNSGHKKASNYLRDYYISQNIPSPINDSIYYQAIPSFKYDGKKFDSSNNVVAFIEGSEKAEEIIIISAHMDHIGIDDSGDVFQGADDNASGTAALLEIAQAFQKAKNDGFGPKRSLLFIHFTAEEKNLRGSEFYVNNPIFPLEKTVSNLNADMMGRIDNRHEFDPNYIYLIGSDRLSRELHWISEAVNSKFINLNLDYKYNDESDSNRYYYRSDHYNFAKNGIPIIFYFNGKHDDYHKTTDTPDKIIYTLIEKRTKLIFVTAWQLANQKNRLIIDN